MRSPMSTHVSCQRRNLFQPTQYFSAGHVRCWISRNTQSGWPGRRPPPLRPSEMLGNNTDLSALSRLQHRGVRPGILSGSFNALNSLAELFSEALWAQLAWLLKRSSRAVTQMTRDIATKEGQQHVRSAPQSYSRGNLASTLATSQDTFAAIVERLKILSHRRLIGSPLLLPRSETWPRANWSTMRSLPLREIDGR